LGLQLFLACSVFLPLSSVYGVQESPVVQNQGIKITGQVKDQKGETLPGVTVALKGSRRAVITDTEGRYTFSDLPKNSVLIFSFIGFETQERVVGSNKVINIGLKETATGLDEVVVIGYGTVKRGDLTGSVGQVNIEDLEKAPVMSFEEALAGRIAGVEVSSGEGQPGEEGTNIVIRGGNSLTQDNSPLYIIDGFPTEDSDNGAINPDDIESITVLKDASATAIYGSRGANGVIIIETKKGKAGKTVISYNGSVGIQEVTKRMELMSPYEFVRYHMELNPSSESRYLDADAGITLESYRDIKGIDWQDRILQTGSTQDHNLSMRGGNNQTRFSISGSIFNRDGVIINSGQKRYQGRVNIDHTVNKKLKTGINLNYSNNASYGSLVSSGGSASSSYLYSVWGYRPITSNVFDEDDEENQDLEEEIIDDEDVVNPSTDTRINPILSAKNELRRKLSNSGSANAYITYAITPELSLKVSGGLNLSLQRSDSFHNSESARGTPRLPRNIRGVNGSVGYRESTSWLNENTLTWKKDFNKNNKLDVLVGFTAQEYTTKGYGYGSQLISNEVLGMSGLDTGTPYSISANESGNRLVSFLGRANYNFRSKYLFTASLRYDASSKFPVDNNGAFFPSGAFAWKMKNEPFMKNLRFISDAKLRMSYGLTGNNRVSDFASLPSLTQPFSAYYSFNGATPSPGITPSNMGNSNLLWETTAQADLGYDISFFKNRLELTVDVYRKTTTDLLLNANVPYATGYSNVYQNIGKIQNQGLEISLNTVNFNTRKFKWQSSFNISFNENKILELEDNGNNRLATMRWENAYNSVPLYIAEVGGPAAMFYGYVWDGLYQLEDFNENGVLKNEIAYHGTKRESIFPGEIKYRDLNGNGVIDPGDQTVLGRTLPIHFGGFSNNFTYKGFNLNVFFQWRYGNKIYNANRIVFEGNAGNSGSLNQFASYIDRWSPENTGSSNFVVRGRGPAAYYSSKHLEDGSFLRLKTIQLSYDIPKTFINRIGMSRLNVYTSAQNLITWHNYSGMDPEVAVRNTTLTPGFDFSAYPRARTIVFGLRADF